MRLPKSVNICGRTVIVVTNRDHDGGSYDSSTNTIEIGTRDPEEVVENVLHEIGETIMIMRGFRYVAEKEELENGDYRFLLNHPDWELFNKDLAVALKGISFK